MIEVSSNAKSLVLRGPKLVAKGTVTERYRQRYAQGMLVQSQILNTLTTLQSEIRTLKEQLHAAERENAAMVERIASLEQYKTTMSNGLATVVTQVFGAKAPPSVLGLPHEGTIIEIMREAFAKIGRNVGCRYNTILEIIEESHPDMVPWFEENKKYCLDLCVEKNVIDRRGKGYYAWGGK